MGLDIYDRKLDEMLSIPDDEIPNIDFLIISKDKQPYWWNDKAEIECNDFSTSIVEFPYPTILTNEYTSLGDWALNNNLFKTYFTESFIEKIKLDTNKLADLITISNYLINLLKAPTSNINKIDVKLTKLLKVIYYECKKSILSSSNHDARNLKEFENHFKQLISHLNYMSSNFSSVNFAMDKFFSKEFFIPELKINFYQIDFFFNKKMASITEIIKFAPHLLKAQFLIYDHFAISDKSVTKSLSAKKRGRPPINDFTSYANRLLDMPYNKKTLIISGILELYKIGTKYLPDEKTLRNWLNKNNYEIKTVNSKFVLTKL